MITNSKIYVEQGTPASPGIIFRGNPITGMSGAGGDFSLSIDNVEKLKLSNAGILSLPGYSGNNGKYLKMDASGVLSADTPVGGATGSEVTYTGFAVKQDGTESATTSVFASKINKVIKLIFEEIKVNISATTNTIKSRILPNDALWPDMAYNHMTSVFINNTQAYGRFVETQNNIHYFEFLTSPTLAWVAGTPITIQPFTITYISANNTALTGITWGTTYSDTVSPTITTFSSSGLVTTSGDIRTINIVFNEIVINFTINDLSAVGGSLSNFTGSGSSYSVTYTANTAGPYSIQISGVYTDVSGNTGPGQTLNLSVNQYLDGSTPVIALGLTRLLTSYTTNKCVRVRNGTDQLIDIGFVNNIFDVSTFNAHKSAGGNGTCRVHTWYNQTGVNHFFAQDGITTEPEISIVDGNPLITFLGSGADYLYSMPYSNGSMLGFGIQNKHTSYVTFSSTFASHHSIFSSPTANIFNLSMNNTTITHIHQGVSVTVAENPLDFNNGTKYFVEHVYNQVTSNLTVGNYSNTVTNSAAVNGTTPNGNLVLGYTPSTTNPSKFTGQIYSYIMYPTDINTTIRNTIKQNILQ
jgi:hypothetical protein